MIVEYIRYTVVDASHGRELLSAYERAARHLDAAPECVAYELAQCEEDENSWVLRIEWRSTQDHLQGFRRGAHFPPFLEEIGPFVKQISEMRHYRVTGVCHRK